MNPTTIELVKMDTKEFEYALWTLRTLRTWLGSISKSPFLAGRSSLFRTNVSYSPFSSPDIFVYLAFPQSISSCLPSF